MKAHYVLCRQDKTPVQHGWNNIKPTRQQAIEHVESGGKLGLVPGSINCLVIDVDIFDDETLTEVTAPFPDALVVESPKGYHVWIRLQGDRNLLPNKRWEAFNGSGDIRGDNGYVVLWCGRDTIIEWFESDPEQHHPGEVLTHLGLGIEGNRNNLLNARVFKAARQGDEVAIQEAIEEAASQGLSKDEIDATTRSALKAATEKGVAIERSSYGLLLMLNKLDIEIRYNTRAMANQFRYKNLPWCNTTDRLLEHTKQLIANTFVYATNQGFKPMRFSPDLWRMAYNSALFQCETDPFADWLRDLPSWDGVPRIDTLLCDMFGAEDNALNRWASGYLFKGALQRTLEPGCKLDTMPVLIGPQGIGKSSLLRQMLPLENPEWFSDALNLSADMKMRAEMLQGRVIVEVGEMIGATRGELESLKTFLSRTDDGNVRFAYRQNPETMLRRCIIVGTTNDEQCLPNDPTGLRRFLPVTLKHGCNVEVYMDNLRMMLWAEAWDWWATTFKPTAALPYELIKEANLVREQARRSDEALEDKLEKVAEDLQEGNLFNEDEQYQGLTINDIAQRSGLIAIGMTLGRSDAIRLTSAMKARHWYKMEKMVRNKKKYLWYPSYKPRS